MHRAFMSKVGKLCAAHPWLLLGLGVVLTLPGCGHKQEGSAPPSVTEPPTVRVVHPDYRKIVRVVGQPSFVESYERTSIFPKVTGFIKKWNVDIGDQVKKGDILATLYVPELDEDWETKKATVKLDEEKVQLALEVVEVAKADVQAAEARLVEAQRILDKYKSEVDRWDSEVKRLREEVNKGVVAPQILLESENQHRSDVAAWESAKATVEKAKAQLLSAKATLKKNIVDVEVARRDVAVATSDAKRMEAWVGYLQLIAPYDGIVTRRNANTWDFVLPLTGDPSADQHAPALSPGNKAAPIYVVERTDVVRVFVDIPEADANYVKIGTRAKVQIKGYKDQWIPGKVDRTSWALNVKSRTLRAEIDLKNINSEILPGMYAYGQVIIERPDVRALPEAALIRNGDQTFYWSYENGKATKVEVQTGISDGVWTEVTSRQHTVQAPGEDTMTPIDGKEQVILGDLSVLTEGGAVKLANAPANDKAEKK
jgi:multidrug efflux pump subunit AcrA (membrane-fusion protein)